MVRPLTRSAQMGAAPDGVPVVAHRAGYSGRRSKQQGSRLLTNVVVRAAIAEPREARAKRTGLAQDACH